MGCSNIKMANEVKTIEEPFKKAMKEYEPDTKPAKATP